MTQPCDFKEKCEAYVDPGELYGPCDVDNIDGEFCKDGGGCSSADDYGTVCVTPESSRDCPPVPLNSCGLPMGYPVQDIIGRCFFVCDVDADCAAGMSCFPSNFPPETYGKGGICVWPPPWP